MSDDPPRRAPFVTIVDAIAELPRDQVVALITALRERLGVHETTPRPVEGTRNPPWAYTNPPGPAPWRVRIETSGPDRVALMRLLRARFALPIAEVKTLVEGLPRELPRTLSPRLPHPERLPPFAVGFV